MFVLYTCMYIAHVLYDYTVLVLYRRIRMEEKTGKEVLRTTVISKYRVMSRNHSTELDWKKPYVMM